MSRFSERGEIFVNLEAGHAARNLCLEAAAPDLGMVTAGLTDYDAVAPVLSLPSNLRPVYVIPAGKKE
jgi:nitroreductase